MKKLASATSAFDTRIRPDSTWVCARVGVGLSVVLFLSLMLPSYLVSYPAKGQTQSRDRPALKTSSQRKASFQPMGPWRIEVILDENGQPLTVRDSGNQEVTIIFDARTWSAPNGTRVFETRGDLRSRPAASEYLRKVLSRAKILARETKTDGKGAPVGERIVALLLIPADADSCGAEDQRKMQAAVIETSGTLFHQIVSESLDVALAFEKYTAQAKPARSTN